MIPFGAAQTYMAYIWEYPLPSPPPLGHPLAKLMRDNDMRIIRDQGAHS